MLQKLKDSGSLSAEDHAALAGGYEVLRAVDHNIRLTIGRTTTIPLADESTLGTIAARMKMSSTEELLETLTMSRLNIRNHFESILEISATG